MTSFDFTKAPKTHFTSRKDKVDKALKTMGVALWVPRCQMVNGWLFLFMGLVFFFLLTLKWWSHRGKKKKKELLIHPGIMVLSTKTVVRAFKESIRNYGYNRHDGRLSIQAKKRKEKNVKVNCVNICQI